MSIAACAEIVRRGDPDRFLAAMSTPVSARAVLFPIYAFNVEVARAPWVASETMIAEMRLQWWRDFLDEVIAGDATRSHEVTTPLAAILNEDSAMRLRRLVDARRWDIYTDPFEDEGHFIEYLDATAGELSGVCAWACGAGERAVEANRRVGWASGLASFLLAIPQLKAHGRKPTVGDKAECLHPLIEQGLERLNQSRSVRRGPAARSAWRARGILHRAQRNPALIMEGLLGGSEFNRRVGLLASSMFGI